MYQLFIHMEWSAAVFVVGCNFLDMRNHLGGGTDSHKKEYSHRLLSITASRQY